MLGIFKKNLVEAPQELNCPASSQSSEKKAKLAEEILENFSSSNTASINFGNALLGFSPPQSSYPIHEQRLFCGIDGVYCIFLGGLNNLSSLIKQYGLSKNTNDAMLVMEAYRTLRDRSPYPADQVLKELEGTFGFVLFDSNSGTIFATLGSNEGVKLFWGIAADGSLVVSDNLELIKSSCAKSFAPFPKGCMFHSEGGLMSFEHPMHKMKAFPRVDSEGALCGASFKVDKFSKISSMPRVGSETNWATWCPNT